MAFDNTKKIGILGGGQLGRMLIQAGIDYDLKIKVLDPDKEASSCHIAHEFVCGDFKDFATVMAFGADCDLITVEIESVNLQALYELEALGKPVYPQPAILEIIKDKRKQKQFYKDHDLPTANFYLTDNMGDIKKHISSFPLVNKIGEGGYDGKGVQILRNENDLEKAFDELSLLEELVDFEKELAVIVSRNRSGEMETFPVVEMVFHPEANLVEYLFAPANVDDKVLEMAKRLAIEAAEAFEIIGLLAVEMFLTKEGELLINEVAPRPHNSGHHTIKANNVSQFEQHLRAILNLPLAKITTHKMAAMVNILGEPNFEGKAKYLGMDDCLKLSGIHPFLYGKGITKPFRKMGHVTILADDFDKLKEKVNFVKNTLKVISE